jgi:predicted transcriptional regulator
MVTTTGIKIDAETKERLKRLGKVKNRTPHWLMKQAIFEFLEREESYEREKAEDLVRWQQFVETGRYVSQDAMSNKFSKLTHGAPSAKAKHS